jgi:DNA (cytosine-5)-methyltransferase 1
MPRKPTGRRTAVSLFTGAGGLDIGVERAGFDVLAAVERDAIACETLRLNFSADRRRTKTEIFQRDIEDLEVSELLERVPRIVPGELDLLVGGPPCTPFSKSGYWIEYKRAGQDPDRFLLDHYVRFVRELRPRAFIMENVQALAYRNHNRTSLDALRDALAELGYNITEDVLVAAEHGVPQVRQRLFLVGALGVMPELPERTNAGPFETRPLYDEDAHLAPFVTCREAFAGLPDVPEAGEEVGGLYGHLLPEIPPGENYLHFTKERGHKKPLFKWRGRYWTFLLKLDPDRPSSTIQAQPGPYIGPFHWDNRRLRTAELKRLQTFPDEYRFHGNRRAVQVQIGNAVPPLLAERVAEALVASVFEPKHAKRIA